MLQQVHHGVSYTHGFFEPQAQSLRSLAYRSIAASDPTNSELHELLRAAQKRNKAEGLSGVLVFDNGAYFQWLEGPSAAVDRVWESISHDSRHYQITVLRDEPISRRLFDGWDLRIAKGARVSIKAAVAALSSSSMQLLKHLIGKPAALVNMSWEDIFASSVIPRLLEVHAHSLQAAARRASTGKIWHAALDSGERLTGALLAPRSNGTARYVDSLIDQGAGLNALYHEVFEPAQLRLGQLWDADSCDDFHLALGLARLQLEVRRVNAAVPGGFSCKPGHSVLMCPQPREWHTVGLVMSSEVFDRNGWEVTCEFPRNDQALRELVQGRWFDVLKLSQSGSLRRDTRLLRMRATIDAARLASVNPAMIVMVDGRTFAERPTVYQAVHANAVALSVLQAVPVAERLLNASRSLTASAQVSVS